MATKKHHQAGAQKGDGVTVIHRGREYQLFKRPGQEKFRVRATVKGKRCTKSLGTGDPAIALKNARIWLDAVSDEDWKKADELRLRSPWCDVGTLVDTYTAGAEGLGVSAAVCRRNGSSLLRLVAIARRLTPDAARAVRTGALNADLIRDFVVAARKAKISDAGIDSTIRKARSVLSAAARGNLYRDLKLPDLREFLDHDAALKPPPDLGFVPFPDPMRRELVDRMNAIKKLLPGVYLVYLLMSRMGLRNSEIWPARWTWFTEREGRVWLEIRPRPDEGFTTKSGEARMLVVSPDLWEELQELRGAENDVYVLPGRTLTERKNLAERDINKIVRPILKGYRKGAYELRRWAGSIVWTQAGPGAAREFLGHASVTTTERYYARNLKPVHGVSEADMNELYGESEALAKKARPEEKK